MIDHTLTLGPFTSLTGNTGSTGDTVEPVRDTDSQCFDGKTGDTCSNNYCSNNYSFVHVHGVATSTELVNRPGQTGQTGSTASPDMPGKFGALEDRVHRTPTEEGFCFGTPAGIF